MKIKIANITDAIKKKAEDTIEKVQENEAFSKENISLKMKEMAQKGSEAVAKFQKESKKTSEAVKEVLNKEKSKKIGVSTSCALKIYYYLISVDKNLDEIELDKYFEIGKNTDIEFDSKKDEIIDACNNVLDKALNDEDYYDLVHDSVGDLLRESLYNDDNTVPTKLLLWNLITIANIDGQINNDEERLIRYISRTLNVDQQTVLEMNASLNTLLEIEKEEYLLKNSDKKYSEVEPLINELNDRKQAIMQGVHALILD